MTTMASQITSPTVVYSIVYSDADQRKHQSSAASAPLAFVWGIHRDRWIPRTRASYAENVSIWWRHHEINVSYTPSAEWQYKLRIHSVVEIISYQYLRPTPIHYGDTSVSSHLQSLVYRLFWQQLVQINIEGMIKARRYWKGNPLVTGGFSLTKGQLCGKRFHVMTPPHAGQHQYDKINLNFSVMWFVPGCQRTVVSCAQNYLISTQTHDTKIQTQLYHKSQHLKAHHRK